MATINFIYKTANSAGCYYLGRHSTENINDGYLGSGRWVRNYENKWELQREIIQFCSNNEELVEIEEQLISEHFNDPLCMNVSIKSIGWPKGFHHTEAAKEKISKNHARHMLGKHWSKEDRKKSSLAHKGLLAGEDHPMYGKIHTEETKLKMSIAKKGKKLHPQTEETKRKIAGKQIGVSKPFKGDRQLQSIVMKEIWKRRKEAKIGTN